MYSVEIAEINLYGNFGDWEISCYQTWMTNLQTENEALLAMQEAIYQEAADNGYSVNKIKRNEFGGLVFGNMPMVYKFINMENPADVTFSSYRITKNYFYEEEVI